MPQKPLPAAPGADPLAALQKASSVDANPYAREQGWMSHLLELLTGYPSDPNKPIGPADLLMAATPLAFGRYRELRPMAQDLWKAASEATPSQVMTPEMMQVTGHYIPPPTSIAAPPGFDFGSAGASMQVARDPQLQQRWQTQDLYRWLASRPIEGAVGRNSNKLGKAIAQVGPDRAAVMQQLSPEHQEMYKKMLSDLDMSYAQNVRGSK